MERTLIQKAKYERAVEIARIAFNTAEQITQSLKQMPRTGKRNRNIFIKSYNRRPGNKKKRSLAMVNTTLSAAFGAADIYRALVQPIPKYSEGCRTFDERGPEIVVNVDGVPYEVKQALKMKDGSFIDLEAKIKKHLE